MKISPTKAGTKKKPRTVKVGLNISNDGPARRRRDRDLLPEDDQAEHEGLQDLLRGHARSTTAPRPARRARRSAPERRRAVVNPTGAGPAPLALQEHVLRRLLQAAQHLPRSDGRRQSEGALGKISSGGAEFGQKLTIDIPEDLQQPSASVYSALTDIKTSLRATAGKGRKKHGIFQTTGCTGRKFNFKSRLTYVNNPTPPAATTSGATDTVSCKK